MCWALGIDTLLRKGTQSSKTAMNFKTGQEACAQNREDETLMHVREEPGQDGRLPHSPCMTPRTARKHEEDGDRESHVLETPGCAGPTELGRGRPRAPRLVNGLTEERQGKPWERPPRSATCVPHTLDPVLQFDGKRIY